MSSRKALVKAFIMHCKLHLKNCSSSNSDNRVEDKSVRYVAEENIRIVKPVTPYGLIHLAGKHFKRWDRESRCFVSNIRDEYPND